MDNNLKLNPTPSNAGLLALDREIENASESPRGFGASEAGAPALDLIAATDGIAVSFGSGLSDEAESLSREKIRERLGPDWELRDDSMEPDASGDAGFRGLTALPPPGKTPPVGEAWELARELETVEGVHSAVPLFAQLAPEPGETPGLAADEDAPAGSEQKRNWHRDALRVPQAWNVLNAKGIRPGQGVVVAVLDTGYTDHPEVFERLTKVEGNPHKVRGLDLLDSDDPRDPLEGRAPLKFPSHGTSVASVIVSPEGAPAGAGQGSDFVNGIAPVAEVMPVRMTTNVALLLPNKLIPALRAAVDQGADVINVSLGIPYPWPALRTAVRYAASNGVILVAAAGNYWPSVVYPAAMPEALAAAACTWRLQPWRWSGAGDAVDVLAPGVAVQKAFSRREGEADRVKHGVELGTGTTFAAACCTGLAALWLSYHGGQRALIQHYGGDAGRVPQAFHYLMRRTARQLPGTLSSDKYGEGLPQAEALLTAKLPSVAELEADVRELQLLLAGLDEDGTVRLNGFAPVDGEHALDTLELGLRSLLGAVESPLREDLLREVRFHIASRPEVFGALREAVSRQAVGSGNLDVVRKELLASRHLSSSLRERLERALVADKVDTGAMPKPPSSPAGAAEKARLWTRKLADPTRRRLRVYAFDPSLGTSMRTAEYNRITVNVRWEDAEVGPVGEYLQVVDVDPATGCAYAPLDLDDPRVLANDGLDPSEGDPQFHQQMVYAVAMKTIGHFERALGRPAFWAPGQQRVGRDREPFVRRLRVYPHALRARNAYYSPEKRALLFGYFRSPGPGGEPTGPTVFTCLSYDIVAHETTHALLDGMYRRYTDGTNPDVLAFHEAFSDIVALFQHFTHPDVLRAAIEETRGNLEADSLLGKLAKQFGEATGKRGALRDAIGEEDATGKWRRRQPDPGLLQRDEYQVSAHLRGSILVAAVFDAFLQIYERRTKPVIRLATGGSGVLPSGNIPTDLAAALAEQASKAAEQVLNICIRALDYLPPLDITFGEYLRAAITADGDLVPDDPLGYRVAFAESFRAWGIHPERVSTVSPESLRWNGPEGVAAEFQLSMEILDELNRHLPAGQVTRNREALHRGTLEAKKLFNLQLREYAGTSLGREIGIDLSRRFEVHTLRPTSSVSPDGTINPTVVVTLTQRKEAAAEGIRTGSTILFNRSDGSIRYVIRKRDDSGARARAIAKYRAFRLAAATESDPYAVYVQQGEPFAALHLTGRL